MKINKNKSFGRVKRNLVSLFIDNEVETILQKLDACFVKDVIPIRKDRSFKRIIKNPHSKSRFKTLTNFKPAY